MFIATVIFVPTMAKAEEQREYDGDAGIFYTNEFNIKEYWNADSSKAKAPTIENCVFGGWYQKVDNTYEPLTEEQAATVETAYAKFVPAYVLSVKAQNMYGTTESTENTSVRIITSVDSKQYKAIGFEVYIANKNQLFKNDNNDPLETTRVYDGIMVNDQPREAEDIFGAASDYVGVWELTDIAKAHYGKIIYVRPYWITKDGTTVKGLAKYVHIEDQYKGYISVPVNVARTEDAAAGAVNLSYDYAGLELAKDDSGNVLFENGRIFPNMAFNADTTSKTIKMVGNELKVGTYSNSEETIYANIRFKKPTTEATLKFDMSLVTFCNWNEEVLKNGTEVKVWDIAYEVKTQ